MAVGLAPIGFENKSSESALSIYPIAIGNCKEKRSGKSFLYFPNKYCNDRWRIVNRIVNRVCN